jgi:hypothetical protein
VQVQELEQLQQGLVQEQVQELQQPMAVQPALDSNA